MTDAVQTQDTAQKPTRKPRSASRYMALREIEISKPMSGTMEFDAAWSMVMGALPEGRIFVQIGEDVKSPEAAMKLHEIRQSEGKIMAVCIRDEAIGGVVEVYEVQRGMGRKRGKA